KKVDVQANQVIHPLQLREGGFGDEAIIANEVPDDRPVLLLDVRAVVFLPGPAAGKRDAVALTPRQQMAVDEFAAVVAVEPHQRHGQPLAHAMYGAAHALLVLAPDGVEFHPRRPDVDRAERTEVEA